MHLLQPGQLFAQRYRVERLLAEGGMGAVFVAEQLATEMKVALKVLWPQILASTSAVQKFQVEAKIAARVNSEHIVRVFDAGFDEETRFPFLVMELLVGREVQDLIVENGPCSPQDAVVYIGQTAMGLDKSHGYVDKQGNPCPIVHRDLKPENLFLTHRENGDPVIKILDFGIAKVLSDNTQVSQEMKGTPLYMAYEQAIGARTTPQTDIWALGLIAFFLIVGKPYWKSAHNEEAGLNALLTEILSMPIVPPSQRMRELGMEPRWGPDFDNWFLRCLHRDPVERFASAGETARALSHALLGTAVVIPGSMALDTGQQWAVGGSGGQDYRAAMASYPTVASSPDLGTAPPAVANAVTGAATLPSTRPDPVAATADKMALAMPQPAAGASKSGAALVIGALGGALAVVVALVVVGVFVLRGNAGDPEAASAPPPEAEVAAAEPTESAVPTAVPTISAAPSTAPAQPPAPAAAKAPEPTPAPPAAAATAGPEPRAPAPAPPGRSSPPPTRSMDDLYGER